MCAKNLGEILTPEELADRLKVSVALHLVDRAVEKFFEFGQSFFSRGEFE